MKTLRYLIIVAAICVYATPIQAQFTQQQATNLVLNQVLTNELDKVDVYMANTAKSGSATMALGNRKTINMPYAANWVYFIDDQPFANWAHPCRYIFVDEATGAYQVNNSDFFPVDWQSDYTMISECYKPTAVDMPVNPNANINGLPPNPNLYAVIINGADQYRYWNDISAIYCTLIDVYGYTKENIFVHYVNGYSTQPFGNDLDGSTPSDDIDYKAYKDTILHTFSEMAGITNTSPEIPELGPNDALFIFVDDHGYINNGHSYIWLPGYNGNSDDDLGDWELAEALENINCAQIIAVMEPCFIGGFKTELSDYTNYNVKCKNRSIQTASNIEPSWPEGWITGGAFDEFVYYWTAAARGFYPNNTKPWEVTHVVGEFPFYEFPLMEGHPGDYNPDINGDGFVQMEEAFAYANDLDTWSEAGYYCPYVPPSDMIPENPQIFTDISFEEDVLSLCGISGHVNTSQAIEGRNYLIGGSLVVDYNRNLTLGNSSRVYFGNQNAKLLVQPSATLSIKDNVSISGNYANSIIVNGDIQIGEHVSFNRHGNTGHFDGLVLNNSNMQTTMNNVTFNETQFKNYGAVLTITNSKFNNCGWAYSFHGNVMVNNCEFINTWLYLENQQNDPNISANVRNSIFNNAQTHAGIDVANYNYYGIENNNITAYRNGIQISNCGHNNYMAQRLFKNTIHNCGRSGVLAYNTKGAFYENYIHNNGIGISLMNKSDMALSGNPQALTNYETNFITDNDSYEIYMSKYGFPWYFHYNVIIDEDNAGNPDDPMVYYHSPDPLGIPKLSVRYNCWGNNFDPDEDLQATYDNLSWSPTWCPGTSSGTTNTPEQMYIDGKEQFETQQYAAAKNTFMQLITTYPKTEYAVSAMKELTNIEQYASNDYQSLKEYYQNNNVIQADTTLQQLSVSMANDCDIKLKKWPRAIDYYEGIINNPPSLEDSVFAIIDLGYLYFLMENSDDRLAYTGQLLQFKPKSKETFIEHRDYLLSLLPGKDLDETMKGYMAALKEGELLQNIPNPITAGNTQIWYKLNNEATVQLNIYNYTGQLISSINEGTKLAGTHHINFNATGLTNGVYFYSININGQTTDTKKMTIVK